MSAQSLSRHCLTHLPVGRLLRQLLKSTTKRTGHSLEEHGPLSTALYAVLESAPLIHSTKRLPSKKEGKNAECGTWTPHSVCWIRLRASTIVSTLTDFCGVLPSTPALRKLLVDFFLQLFSCHSLTQGAGFMLLSKVTASTYTRKKSEKRERQTKRTPACRSTKKKRKFPLPWHSCFSLSLLFPLQYDS